MCFKCCLETSLVLKRFCWGFFSPLFVIQLQFSEHLNYSQHTFELDVVVAADFIVIPAIKTTTPGNILQKRCTDVLVTLCKSHYRHCYAAIKL